MSRLSKRYEYMSLDDFEELLLDKPADEKWELIGGRVIRGMVGCPLGAQPHRREHPVHSHERDRAAKQLLAAGPSRKRSG